MGTLKDKHLGFSGCKSVSEGAYPNIGKATSSFWRELSELYHAAGVILRLRNAWKHSHHMPTMGLCWMLFGSFNTMMQKESSEYLKKNTTKGNMSLMKYDSFINPMHRLLGLGASLVHMLPQRHCLQKGFVSYTSFAKSIVMMRN